MCCLLYCTVTVLYILGLENASGRRTSNHFMPSLRCCAARPTTCLLCSSTTSSFSLREHRVVQPSRNYCTVYAQNSSCSTIVADMCII